ncbi:MAG TPA: hypothetical protein VGB76_19045 [Pyrinomonadaceae bacterium]|jgi:hypothetical protein
MRCLVKRLSAFSVLFLLLGAVESRAQVMTIKSGGIVHSGNPMVSPVTPHGFYFNGDGITAGSSDERGASVGMDCNPCAPGQTVRLNVTISRFTVPAHGSATLNDLFYTNVWFRGSEFKLSTTTVTIPDGDAPEGLKARFTMTGNLIGYTFPFTSPLINREVEGQGAVRIYFTKSHLPDRPGYIFQRAIYNFEARPARSRKEASLPSRPSPLAQQ